MPTARALPDASRASPWPVPRLGNGPRPLGFPTLHGHAAPSPILSFPPFLISELRALCLPQSFLDISK